MSNQNGKILTLYFFFSLSNRNRKHSGDNGWLSKRHRDPGASTKRHPGENDDCRWHASRAGIHQRSVGCVCRHRLHHHDDYIACLAHILLHTTFPVYGITIWKPGNCGWGFKAFAVFVSNQLPNAFFFIEAFLKTCTSLLLCDLWTLLNNSWWG